MVSLRLFQLILLSSLILAATGLTFYAEADPCCPGCSYKNAKGCCCAPNNFKVIWRTKTVSTLAPTTSTTLKRTSPRRQKRQDIFVQHLCGACPKDYTPFDTWSQGSWPMEMQACCPGRRTLTKTFTVVQTINSNKVISTSLSRSAKVTGKSSKKSVTKTISSNADVIYTSAANAAGTNYLTRTKKTSFQWPTTTSSSTSSSSTTRTSTSSTSTSSSSSSSSTSTSFTSSSTSRTSTSSTTSKSTFSTLSSSSTSSTSTSTTSKSISSKSTTSKSTSSTTMTGVPGLRLFDPLNPPTTTSSTSITSSSTKTTSSTLSTKSTKSTVSTSSSLSTTSSTSSLSTLSSSTSLTSTSSSSSKTSNSTSQTSSSSTKSTSSTETSSSSSETTSTSESSSSSTTSSSTSSSLTSETSSTTSQTISTSSSSSSTTETSSSSTESTSSSTVTSSTSTSQTSSSSITSSTTLSTTSSLSTTTSLTSSSTTTTSKPTCSVDWSAEANSAILQAKYTQQYQSPGVSFTSQSNGDGWDVGFVSTGEVVNVYHHSTSFKFDCHLRNGSSCANGPWPRSWSGYTTSYQSFTILVDDVLYSWVMKGTVNQGGIIRVFPNGTNLAFYNLTDNNETGLKFVTQSGPIGGARVGKKLYAINNCINSTQTDGNDCNKLLCFDVETLSACRGQPYSLNYPSGWSNTFTSNSQTAWSYSIDSNVYVFQPWKNVAGQRGVITCFDTVNNGNCTGSWPVIVPDSAFDAQQRGTPQITSFMGYLNDGLCIGGGTSYSGNAAVGVAGGSSPFCWSKEGTVIGSLNIVPQRTKWGPTSSLNFQDRGYIPSSKGVHCIDFATNQTCNGYPMDLVADTTTYSVRNDPLNPGCLWVNGDSGYLSSFWHLTGGNCSSLPYTIVRYGLDLPTGCNQTVLGWKNFTITSPSGFGNVNVTMFDLDDNFVVGFSLTEGSIYDLSSVPAVSDLIVKAEFGAFSDVGAVSALGGYSASISFDASDRVCCTMG